MLAKRPYEHPYLVVLREEGGSTLSVSNYFRKHQSHSLLTTARWVASEKYEFEGFFEYDLRRTTTVNQQYSLIRNFHRWACVLSLEVDEGEEDDVRLLVNFGPRELIQSLQRGAHGEQRDRSGW